MADKTAISWTDATWNPIRGCSRVSTGCENCYAERTAHRFSGPGQLYDGLTRKTKNGPRWTGKIKLVPEKLDQPNRWRRPRRIFVNSMSDLFHPGVPDEFIAAIFGIMAGSPQHTHQLLTKRVARMLKWFSTSQDYPTWCGESASRALGEGGWSSLCFGAAGAWPLPNVHVGVSVENQEATQRLDVLAMIPAAVRFVSVEPMIGPVDLRPWLVPPNALDWVIVGGESGPGFRPCDSSWIVDVADQCYGAGVPVFVKQAAGPKSGTQGAIPDEIWNLREFPTHVQEAP